MNVCSICSAGPTKRDAINAAIVQGIPQRDIAVKYTVSQAAISRHSQTCIATQVAKAQVVQDEFSAESLIRTLQDVKRKAEDIYARNVGVDDGLALKALARIDGVVQTSARICQVITEARAQSGKGNMADILRRGRIAAAERAKKEQTMTAEIERLRAQLDGRVLPAPTEPAQILDGEIVEPDQASLD